MLLARFSRVEKGRRKQRETYRDLLDQPLHRLITSLLEWVVLEAEAVGIGFRKGDLTDEDARQWIAEQEGRMAEIARSTDETLHAKKLGAEPILKRALLASSLPKGPEGAQGVPVWVRVRGRNYPHQILPVRFYASIITCVCERLVSIDGTEEAPQPTRYIELSEESGNRRFAEVELSYDEQNCFWVKVLGVRTVDFGSNVSRYYY